MTLLMYAAALIGPLCGLVLFRRKLLESGGRKALPGGRVSVIIPARNEEINLPHLLGSLVRQSVQPDEIIVVDDHSEDGTRAAAERYGVRVLSAPELPAGWTGKNWALWNGYLHSTGDILVFLDADIRLADDALEALLATRSRLGGVISVVPYHQAEKFHEKWAMILNLLGAFAFTSPFETSSPGKGVYGACVVASRSDYERIGGHESVRGEMLDDLTIGAQFMRHGIPVHNFLGAGKIRFRMYPHGWRSELEGFAKGAILSTSSLSPWTLLFVIVWIVGLVASESFPLFYGTQLFVPLLAAYVAYSLEIFYFNRSVGSFGLMHPLLHVLSLLFFLVVVAYSLYESVILKKVAWKGRFIDVGRNRAA